jgi:hypothetical protein
VRVSEPGDSEHVEASPEDASSVLGNLPRSRPQRASARRASSRARAAAASSSAAPAAAENGREAASKTSATASKPARAKASRARTAARPGAKAKTGARGGSARIRAVKDEVPRQGYAGDGDRVSGPVPPPGGPELLATAGEIVSELAKAGASAGERLVRDLFSRLPGS